MLEKRTTTELITELSKLVQPMDAGGFPRPVFQKDVLTDKYLVRVPGTRVETDWESEGRIRAELFHELARLDNLNWRKNISTSEREKCAKYLNSPTDAWQFGRTRTNSFIHVIADGLSDEHIPVLERADPEDGIRHDRPPTNIYTNRMLWAWYLLKPEINTAWSNVTFYHHESESRLSLFNASAEVAKREFETFAMWMSNHVICNRNK